MAEGGAAPGLVINGKFLQPTTSRSGVYRVAREMLVALDKVLAENPALAAAMPCRLLVPGGLPEAALGELRLSCIQVDRRQRRREMGPRLMRLTGLLWEQLVLPWRARGSTLVSLCNIGPVVYRNAFTLVHDAQVYSSPASYSRAFRAWYRTVLPLLGRSNRSLLTVSQYSRKQLAHFGVANAARIRVIHNGVDHVLRLAPDPAKVQSAGLAAQPYVLALANTQPHKNVGVLLKAFQSPMLKDVTLALFGPATREDFERQGHKVPSNVSFLGFVSDEELAGLLQQAAALAFPSTTEGFGLPPLEAMLRNCPAIVAPRGALPEVCGDAVLWAHPQDPQEWAQQIRRLCSDAQLRDQTQERGRAHAAQFTWRRAACRLLETVLGHSLADTGLMQAQLGAAERQLQRGEPQAAPALRRGLSS
ncbi:Glycosyltransferase involved in cell wall bisynthesis [Variovorax sp. OV329]|nr:Glycosyltransferase involved in cell wall bisynthesis [Variovorax sp. OV329]